MRFLTTFCLLLTFWMVGCTRTEVRTTDYTPVKQVVVSVPDEYLLDVGVALFDPGIDDLKDDELVYPATRKSESVWVATVLKQTLDRSRAWGVTRVLPHARDYSDLEITGRILQSDGETMRLRVKAVDATGQVWMDKEFKEQISHYAYSPSNQNQEDPFQGIYNEISNELLALLNAKSHTERTAIRTVADLKFARSFAPEAFTDYLQEDTKGRFIVDRLPAENDPILQRIHQIEARDQLFQDVLGDYYNTFTLQMDEPYTVWRQQSYIETISIQELDEAARNRKIAGILGVIGGIAAQWSGDAAVRTTGVIGISAGAWAIQSGYQKSDEAKLHEASLQEMSQSLESDLSPSVISLQDRTVTLTGTVEDQYAQWREILRQIYYQETGYEPESTSPDF